MSCHEDIVSSLKPDFIFNTLLRQSSASVSKAGQSRLLLGNSMKAKKNEPPPFGNLEAAPQLNQFELSSSFDVPSVELVMRFD